MQRKGIRVQNIWDLSGITFYFKLKINFYRGIVPLIQKVPGLIMKTPKNYFEVNNGTNRSYK